MSIHFDCFQQYICQVRLDQTIQTGGSVGDEYFYLLSSDFEQINSIKMTHLSRKYRSALKRWWKWSCRSLTGRQPLLSHSSHMWLPWFNSCAVPVVRPSCLLPRWYSSFYLYLSPHDVEICALQYKYQWPSGVVVMTTYNLNTHTMWPGMESKTTINHLSMFYNVIHVSI